MKKILIILICTIILFSLVGCDKGSKLPENVSKEMYDDVTGMLRDLQDTIIKNKHYSPKNNLLKDVGKIQKKYLGEYIKQYNYILDEEKEGCTLTEKEKELFSNSDTLLMSFIIYTQNNVLEVDENSKIVIFKSKEGGESIFEYYAKILYILQIDDYDDEIIFKN